MKKITVFILTIFTIATLFAAARPSLDGRAVVADSGTMPRGLFARTVGYLPGDSVTVTNPATGTTADVLVLGAIDPSEGVAILLSPEAADALRISPNSNVQVKLTKRSGSLDENATGSAVISDEIQNVIAAENINEVPAEEIPEAEKNEIAEETPAQESAEIAVASAEETAVPEEAPAAEETVVLAEEKTASDNAVDESAAKEASSIPVEEVVEVPAEIVPKVTETVAIAAETTETPVPATEPVVPASVSKENAPETIQPVILVEKEAEETKSEPVILEPVEEELPALVKDGVEAETLQPVIIVETEVPVAEEAESETVEEPVIPSEEAVAEEPVIPAEEEVAVEGTYAKDEEISSDYLPDFVEKEPEVVVEDVEPYQPIVLVPAEPNPPVAEEKVEPVKEETPAPVVEQPKPVAVKETPAAVSKPVVSNDWTNYVVPSHNNLVKGYYYIQIASLGNVENIKNIIKKYGSKYPVVLIQSTNGRTYQVLVGPLNIDEYGSVLAKFKAYGYKDAFVKRIK